MKNVQMRKVLLPAGTANPYSGRVVRETRETVYGSSEAQDIVRYTCHNCRVPLDGFKTDHWGAIVGVIEVSESEQEGCAAISPGTAKRLEATSSYGKTFESDPLKAAIFANVARERATRGRETRPVQQNPERKVVDEVGLVLSYNRSRSAWAVFLGDNGPRISPELKTVRRAGEWIAARALEISRAAEHYEIGDPSGVADRIISKLRAEKFDAK